MTKTLPPGWLPMGTLQPEPLPTSHGPECICRSCASGAYASLLETSDYQRHEITRLRSELQRLQFAFAVEKYRRLTLVIAAAVANGDKATWADAVKERLELGVAVMQKAEGL